MSRLGFFIIVPVLFKIEGKPIYVLRNIPLRFWAIIDNSI